MIFSRQIVYFFCLSKTHSYSTAAELLCITESALRHAINKLESHYNKKLFYRDKSEIILTDSGWYLYKKLHFDFERIQNVSIRFREPRPQEIKIITDSFFYPFPYSKMKSLSTDNFHGFNIVRNPDVSFRQLRHLECDLIIISYINELPPPPEYIFRIQLSTKPLGLLMHDCIFKKYKSAMQIISSENIYQRSNVINQIMIDGLCEKSNIQPIKCNFKYLPEIMDVLKLIMSGEGICFTTKDAIGNIDILKNSLFFLDSQFPFSLALHTGIYLLKDRYDELIETALSIKKIFQYLEEEIVR